MATFSVVLDACVLIPRYMRAILLDAAERDMFRPVWSTRILDETERNLIKLEMMTEQEAARLRLVLETYFEDAIVDAPAEMEAAMTNHRKDRHVLATAVHEGATVIVTENLRDFPAAMIAPHRIEAKSVDDFLVDLFHLDPDGMRAIVRDRSAEYKNPPISIEELTAILAKFAPKFGALLAS